MSTAFGYVRLSKEDTDSTSPQRQEAAIRRLAQQRRWELVHVFTDLESAYNGKHRPDFEEMMQRLPEVEFIAVWRLDRLSRGSMIQTGRIAEECARAGVRVVTTDSGDIDWTTADGEYNFAQTMALARRESKLISERTRVGLDHVRSLGHYTSRPPFGWRIEDKRLVPHPEQQETLKEAARRYVDGGTLQAIARDLGFSAAGPLSKMLHSERVQEALSDEPDDLRGRLVTALRDRKQERGPRSKQSLLGGIARCGVCGGGMAASSTRADRKGRWYSYGCPTAGHVHIAAPWLDAFVTDAVIEAVDVRKLAASLRRRQKMAKPRKVSEIEARIELLDDMLAKGEIAADRYRRNNATLIEQLAAAQREERSNGVEPIPVELARNLAEKWPTLDVPTRRKLIRAALESVTVEKAKGNGPIDAGRVALRWRAA